MRSERRKGLLEIMAVERSDALAPNMPGWVSVNFPPGVKRELCFGEGICPYFDLICQVGALLGKTEEDIRKDPDNFCGRWEASMGGCHIPTGPNCACGRMANELGKLIQRAEGAIQFPIHVRRGRVRINCTEEELPAILSKYQASLWGEEALQQLIKTVPLTTTRKGRERLRTDKEVVRYAREKLFGLCRRALGVKDFRGLCDYNGMPTKTGCPLAPQNLDSGIKW